MAAGDEEKPWKKRLATLKIQLPSGVFSLWRILEMADQQGHTQTTGGPTISLARGRAPMPARAFHGAFPRTPGSSTNDLTSRQGDFLPTQETPTA